MSNRLLDEVEDDDPILSVVKAAKSNTRALERATLSIFASSINIP